MMIALQKKICMLGGVGVGKTSLVRRYVESLFSERYQATVGVKIDRKTVVVGDHTLNLMLWDLQGETELQRVRLEYLRGAAGYLLVVDVTRRESLVTALELGRRAAEVIPGAAVMLVLNKTDLVEQRVISDADVAGLAAGGWRFGLTSARSGEGVEVVFRQLAEQLARSGATAMEGA
ncbi:MAG: Rab family GTPase [Gemmatimonadales bacterium]